MSQPTVKVTSLVDARDGYSCTRCGVSLTVTSGSRHHRQRRRVGGHIASVLILLCGSGTTGCHGWAHANPERARAAGYIVAANGRATAADIPVLTHAPGIDPYQTHVWYLLDDHGNRHHTTDTRAREILASFGIDFPVVTP